MVEYQSFLKEYKLDQSQATCIACNQQFSIHYRGKADIEAIKKKDEIAAAEGVLTYHSNSKQFILCTNQIDINCS